MSRNLRSAIGVAMLALVAGVVVFLANSRPKADGASASPRAETTSERGRELENVTVAGRTVALDSEPGNTIERSPADVASRPKLTISDENNKIEIRGAAIAVDRNGIEHTTESGTLELIIKSAEQESWTLVDVQDGKWTAIIDKKMSSLEVVNLVLRERVAFVGENEQRISIPENRFITIRAKWPPPVSIRVIDQKTEADLTGIQILTNGYGVSGDSEHPGDVPSKNLFIDNGVSPIEFAPKFDFRIAYEMWIRAPGYAWKKAKINMKSSGERTIALSRAASLDVNIQPAAPNGAFVKIFEFEEPEPTEIDEFYNGSPRCDFRCDGKTTLQLESLEPGIVGVLVSVGEQYQRPQVLAAKRVEMRAGERATVLLEIKELVKSPVLAPAPFRGTLILHPDWNDVKFDLGIHKYTTRETGFRDLTIPKDKLTKMSAGVYEWDAGKVPPGKYSIESQVLGIYVIFEVPPAGLTDAVIQIPEATNIQIRLVDIHTGDDVKNATLAWSGTEMAELLFSSVARDSATLQFDFRVPSGKVILYFGAPGYQHESQEISLISGLYTKTLTLRKPCGARLIFKDGDAIVPSSRFYCEIEPIGHSGRELSTTNGDSMSGTEYFVSEPGRYRIVIPKIKGYEEIKPPEFDISEAKIIDVIVQLKRAK